MPRPAMVWMLGVGRMSSWRMRWLAVSARVGRLAGERVIARGLSRVAAVAGALSPEKD